MSGTAPPTYDEQHRAITEALAHLLDPLEETVLEDEAPRAPAAYPRLLVQPDRAPVRDLVARVRWSDRNRFRIPRLVARWSLLAAFVCGVIWFVSARGSP